MFDSCDKILKRAEIVEKIFKFQCRFDTEKKLDFICWDKEKRKFYIYLGYNKYIYDDSVDILLNKYYYWLKKNKEKLDINCKW